MGKPVAHNANDGAESPPDARQWSAFARTHRRGRPRMTPLEGFSRWSATYDHTPNPLLALEQRMAAPILGPLANLRVADLCAGTGRWTSIARDQGANVIAVDLCPEMLRIAARKTSQAVLADLLHLPLATDSADLAVCSFGMSYVSSVDSAFAEMSRIAHRIFVSDLHPAATQAGWTRTLPIKTITWSFADLASAALKAGLKQESSTEAYIGEPERPIFEAAGKQHIFDELRRIPAIFVKTWVRQC